MTMPSERTLALISAAEFLQELRLADNTPAAIRAQAIRVLRHFPDASSIAHEAELQMRSEDKSSRQAWLLPVDYFDR